MRRLRGTKLDVFGYTKVRRAERELVGEDRALVVDLLGRLTPDNHRAIVDIAALPDMVRGYESVKLDNAGKYRDAVAAGLAGLADQQLSLRHRQPSRNSPPAPGPMGTGR